MAINKIIYGGETLIDLTADTVSADKVLTGITFHGKDGVKTTGTCDYDSNTQDATAAVAEVLSGKTYYGQGVKKTGTMPNIGKQTGSISTKTGSVTISQGYHDGSGKVTIASTEQAKLIPENIRDGVTLLGVTGTMSGSEDENPEESKTVTPTTEEQTITPSEGYTCMRQIVVSPIPYVESQNTYGVTVTIG